MKGSITEMLSVLERDEKFGFVNPRTNNATIATYGGKPSSPEDGFAAFSRSHGLLPKYQIVPVAVGFCLLIRAEIIKFFGYLDFVYGVGYNEENDFIMRANRRGYSSVLANHSYVAHLGKASFSIFCKSPEDLNRKNEEVFLERYPEFKPAINRFFASPRFLAQRLIERDNDFDVILDLRCAIKARNGTTKLIRDLLPYLLSELRDLKLAIAADPEVMRVSGHQHSRPRRNNLRQFPRDQRGDQLLVFTAVLVGCRKPHGFHVRKDRLLHARHHRHRLPVHPTRWPARSLAKSLHVWRHVRLQQQLYDGSDSPIASASSLKPRFWRQSIPCIRPNTSAQRRAASRSAKSGPPNVLIFGNHYEHKGLHPALNALVDKGFDLTVFGAKLNNEEIPSFAAGQISERKLSAIWAKCDVLVFPSFYEGFGFPIMEAVGRSKPIVLIDFELNRSLHLRLGQPHSFFFFNDFRELPEIVGVAAQFSGPWPDIGELEDDGWRRSAREIAEAIRRSLNVPVNYAKLEQRIFSLPSVS